MAQHEQLKVPDLDAPATAKQHLQQRNERQVDERQDHRAILSAPATPELPGRSGFWHPSRFLTFAGSLGEEYVLRLARSSLRHAEAAGAVQIHGELEFHVGKDRRDSPDVAIASGPDLVLIEVYSGRMSLQARTDVSSSALEDFVRRAVADKLHELANRVNDLLAGHLRYHGVDLAIIRNIWPVLVLAGDSIAPTPLLWGHLRATCPRCFVDDARVRRQVICDLDDIESLLALAEEGKHAPDLLSQFLRSGAEELPPRNWISQVYGHERRPSFVEHQYQHAMEDVRHTLFGLRHGRRP